MTAMPKPKHSLDDVLAEISALPAPPNGQELREWLRRYPAFKADIVQFVTAWIDMEATKVGREVTPEKVNRIVNRTMSRVQQMLDESEKPAAISDLTQEITTAGHTLESFQRALGIDHSMLTCLAARMIRPATIPLRLVREIAEHLRRSIELVRAYFRRPPQLAAAYKARRKPVPAQKDFAYIVQHAELPEPEKTKWLAEAPDPALRG
jgi:hypothetical protein